MKKQLLSLLGAVMLVSGLAQAQTSGGPDVYGYRWAASNAPATANPPTYVWNDITATGTQVTGLADDNFVGPFSMPNFTYYWNQFNSFTIGSNGYIKLGDQGMLIASSSANSGFGPFPAVSQGTNVIAPVLADLTMLQGNGTPVAGASVYYQVSGSKLIVQWNAVPYWTPSTANQVTGSNTFQVILDGADSSVTFNYQRVTITPRNITGTYTNYNRFGLSGPVNGTGLNVGSNQSNVSARAYKFTYPRNSTYSFNDVAVNWIHNPENLAIAAYKEQPFKITANVRNTGTITSASAPRATMVMLDALQNIVQMDTVDFPRAMNKGVDTTIQFPKGIPLGTAPGIYLIQVTVRASGDQLPLNDDMVAKLSLVDSAANGEIRVGFDYGDTTVIKTAGSSGGMSFDLPFYPANVVAVEFLSNWPDNAFWSGRGIVAADSITPFKVSLYQGPSLPGANNLVESFTVANSLTEPAIGQIVDTFGVGRFSTGIADRWIRIRRNLTTPLNVTGGTLYLGVEEPGRTTGFIWNGLLRDTLAPTSGRAFEITNGVWAPNREREAFDYGFRLILKSLGTVIGIPRVEQSVAIGNPYPNPATDLVRIPLNLKQAGNVSMRVVSMSGQVVREENLGNQTTGLTELSLNVADLNKGVYVMQVTTPQGVYNRRVVVR